MSKSEPRYVRTIWVSDVHLGTPGAKAEFLVEFLNAHRCDTLYLVGDIIDGWRLRNSFYWPQEHSNVIRKVLTKAKHGTKVYYVTGNHDEFLRRFVRYDLQLGNIRLVNEVVHTTVDGRRLLVMHGDLFDVITRYHRWIALAGDVMYRNAMQFNYWFNRARGLLGMRYWSLSAFAKQRVKAAVNVIGDFEQAVIEDCKRRGYDGVVCGHIHHAEARQVGGLPYYNCGDWVESCTALVENMDGSIELIHWVPLERLNESPKTVPLRPAA